MLERCGRLSIKLTTVQINTKSFTVHTAWKLDCSATMQLKERGLCSSCQMHTEIAVYVFVARYVGIGMSNLVVLQTTEGQDLLMYDESFLVQVPAPTPKASEPVFPLATTLGILTVAITFFSAINAALILPLSTSIDAKFASVEKQIDSFSSSQGEIIQKLDAIVVQNQKVGVYLDLTSKILDNVIGNADLSEKVKE